MIVWDCVVAECVVCVIVWSINSCFSFPVRRCFIGRISKSPISFPRDLSCGGHGFGSCCVFLLSTYTMGGGHASFLMMFHTSARAG